MKRRYRRYFIIFELGDKNFGTFVGEEAKGHAKIEIKNNQGLLSIHCQNLQSSSDGNRYRWYLINTKTDEAPTIVEIGPMEVDEKGRGELICEFNTENVKGSMEQIDNFDVLASVVRNKDKEDELCTPLVGYMGKEKSDAGSWRYALGKYLYIPLGREKVTERRVAQPYQSTYEVAEETIDEIADETVEEITEEATKESMEETADEVIEETMEKIADEVTEEHIDKAVDETAEEITESVIEKSIPFIRSKVEQKDSDFVETEKDDSSVETEKDEYEVQMQAYIENLLKDFPKVEPFVDNLEDYIWWQIPYNAQTMYRPYMPFILYLDSLNEPTGYHVSEMLQLVYIHQHHIFGIRYDKNNKAEYYAYGISGRNLPSEQPFKSNKDLAYWHPCDNVPVNIESHGYWILTIDPKTGEAVK